MSLGWDLSGVLLITGLGLHVFRGKTVPIMGQHILQTGHFTRAISISHGAGVCLSGLSTVKVLV